MPTIEQILDLQGGTVKTASQYEADLDSILSSSSAGGYGSSSLRARAEALDKLAHQILPLEGLDVPVQAQQGTFASRRANAPALPPKIAASIEKPKVEDNKKTAGSTGAAIGSAAGSPLGVIGSAAGAAIGSKLEDKKKKKKPEAEEPEVKAEEEEAEKTSSDDSVVEYLVKASADDPQVQAAIIKCASTVEGKALLVNSYNTGLAAANADIEAEASK